MLCRVAFKGEVVKEFVPMPAEDFRIAAPVVKHFNQRIGRIVKVLLWVNLWIYKLVGRNRITAAIGGFQHGHTIELVASRRDDNIAS